MSEPRATSRKKLTRRGFLSALAGPAAASLGAAVLAAEAAPGGKAPRPPRISTSTVHFAKLPIEEACERIGKMGFGAVDIWSSFGDCHHLEDALKRLPPGALKDLLRRHRLELNAFSVYTDGYPKYAEYLGKVGGGVAVFGSAPPAKPGELVPRMKEFLERLKPQVELAEKHDGRLAIENHGNALLDGLDTLKAFTDLNRHPRVGIALAPYHIQAGKMSVEEAIRVCGKQLFFFYAWQNAPGLDQLPGHGPADFTPWIRALLEVRFEGWLNAFMHGDLEPDAMGAALVKSRAYLEERAAKVSSG